MNENEDFYAGTKKPAEPPASIQSGEIVDPARREPIVADFSGFAEFDDTKNGQPLGWSLDQPAKLTNHRTVMDLQSSTPEYAIYEQAQDEPGEQVEAISLRGDVFDDMGRPAQVTVSVRPGNRLNS